MFKLVTTSLEVGPIHEHLTSPSAGAFNCFEGRVRDHHQGRKVIVLEYQAYDALCYSEARLIIKEAKFKFGVISVVCVHRTGKVNVGEMAVWVGTIAPHRDKSFKACRYIIDEIKTRLPIWKKEYYANEEPEWVNCACVDHPPSPSRHSLTLSQDPDRMQRVSGDTTALAVGLHTKINEEQFYSRQVRLKDIGERGQQKLNGARILVVGAGGLGSSILYGLAGSGIGTIGICESETLDESNLHRQYIYSHADIGKPKAQLAAGRINALNPAVNVKIHPVYFHASNAENMLKDYDIIVDGTDNFPTKFLLNDSCYLNKKPLVQASIYQFDGQLHTLMPGKSGCLRCDWPQIPESECVGTCDQAGVHGCLPSLFGQLQVIEVIKIVCGLQGILDEKILIWNLRDYHQSLLTRRVNPVCALCGPKPTIKTISEDLYMSKPDDLEITIQDAVNEGLKKFIFIDVRESDELEVDPVSREIISEHRPMSEWTPDNFHLDADKEYIIFCAKGARSYQICDYCHQNSKSNVRSLIGGTEAIKAYFNAKNSSV